MERMDRLHFADNNIDEFMLIQKIACVLQTMHADWTNAVGNFTQKLNRANLGCSEINEIGCDIREHEMPTALCFEANVFFIT